IYSQFLFAIIRRRDIDERRAVDSLREDRDHTRPRNCGLQRLPGVDGHIRVVDVVLGVRGVFNAVRTGGQTLNGEITPGARFDDDRLPAVGIDEGQRLEIGIVACGVNPDRAAPDVLEVLAQVSSAAAHLNNRLVRIAVINYVVLAAVISSLAGYP